MIVREVASLVIIAIMGTVMVLQNLDRHHDKEIGKKDIKVCVEYYDSEGHKIKECTIEGGEDE